MFKSVTAQELFEFATEFNSDRKLHEVLTDCKEAAEKGEYYLFASISKDEIEVLDKLQSKGFIIESKTDMLNHWSICITWTKS